LHNPLTAACRQLKDDIESSTDALALSALDALSELPYCPAST
jgi:hypothetical protein